ncbi:fatty acid synthase-like isoform X2 [Aricia agestis]|uniref:fatty acid synthase-like isoform X2 n=1 Tax=Aricia agestis TaxID=91739 RepID=UPI001C202670|nr:fatty acid synthase-like isoform X2 [Aricia agestis]
MTPRPQEFPSSKADADGERVVISGMAGLYPDCHDVKQLSEVLYNKINPIKKTNRWQHNHPEVAQFNGNIPDLSYFDAQFFKVHYRLCNNMDPMARKILEQSYQAIYDAGVSPEHLSGKKVGVYIGTCFSETEKACFYVASSRTGFGIAGCNKSMFANRISYWLNAKGPSMSVDAACCSSLASLELAYNAISRGDCEAAIVGGGYLCLHPQSSVHYGRIMNLSMDGKTKSFDTDAAGCAKSEAINVLFLQKAKDALRAYARVVHVKSEFMSLPQSEIGAVCGFNRNPADITRFLKTFYEEANVSPRDIQFVEAFGAGSQECDKTELVSIDEFFCKGRTEPLMVGSVMSNIGYVEAASGLSSITKVLLGYHHGKIAANLNYLTPRDDIPAIRDGRIQILSNHEKLIPTYYTAINSFSMTGEFGHILLQGYNKKKDIEQYTSILPRLVLSSGRQETSVKKIFNYLKSKPIDPEELALLNHFHEKKIGGHLGRGFIILDTKENNETVSLHEECTYFDQCKRPLWFVYSGMGSQWTGMGKALMRIPVFAAAIERCQRVLEPKGLNIVDIITSDDKKILDDNIIHSFVGINAIQIGLTDVLRSMGIVPDYIIGHSMGELGCAYADGCFTAEETIQCAYSRGLVSIQTPLIRGSMAAVGLGHKEMSKLCPPEIEVACHNSAFSCTISGPADIMKEFLQSLNSKGIFAKEVPCSNIAYHSRYIADAGPGLKKIMQDLIKTPRLRSSRWVSTSVPQDRWDEPEARYSSAEYHTNNLLNPVLFEETSQLIPPDAVLIEVAPHGLLQAILKRSLPQSCKLIPLTRREHHDNCLHLLEAVGRLYMEGYNPKIQALYPQVEFPVSTSTPMLSHLVDWVYQEKWSVLIPTAANKAIASISHDVICTYDKEHSYLKGHILRGKNLYPFSAALVAVWDTLADSLNMKKENLSVQFENVYFYAQPVLHKKHQMRPYVAIQKGNGRFEVINEKSVIMTGNIIPEITNERNIENIPTSTDETNISTNDIYQLLSAREYQYLNDFRSIHSTNESLSEAQIRWKNNWVTFLDGIIQLNILKRKHISVSKLNLIKKITIDVNKQRNSTFVNNGAVLINAKILELYDVTICGGVIMESIKFIDMPVLKNDNMKLKTCDYLPLFSAAKINEMKSFHMFLQIVADNTNISKEKLSIADTWNGDFKIQEIISSIPGLNANYFKINFNESKNFYPSIDLIITYDLLNNDEVVQKLKNVLAQNTYIINKNNNVQKDSPLYTLVGAHHNIEGGILELAIWRPTKSDMLKSLVIRAKSDSSLQTLQDIPGGEYYFPLDVETDSIKGASLRIAQIGNLDSLYWVNEIFNGNQSGAEVKVSYVGVNAVYVKKLLSTQFHEDNEPTKSVIDFSGFTKSGTRVMGLAHSDAVSSQINANPELLLSVPEHWTLEDAATVPLAYSMAFYILFIKVHLTSKHIICVQGATGALGQAIISVALAHGSEVFATVSSNSKKQFLKKMFPELKNDHIIDHSRDINFAYYIQHITNGKGCNLLVSCAMDELKDSSFRCLASYGVMIDTIGIPSRENYKFGMHHLFFDKVYSPIDFSTIFQQKFSGDIQLIRLLMIDGIRRGYVRPLSRVTYQAQDAPRAFRLQAASNHRGRVLLDLQQLKLNITPSIKCSSSSRQLIISDHEMLALKLAERLIKRGAKHIVMLLENVSNYVNLQIRQWENDNVRITITKTNPKEKNYCAFMKNCKDGLLENIFIITSNEKDKNVIEAVNKLAVFITKSTFSLEYFALLTTSKFNIKSGSRFGTTEYNEIITKIELPEIEQTHEADGTRILEKTNAVSINSAIDALEQALCSQKKNILVHISNVTRKTLLDEILSLAGIKPGYQYKNGEDDFKLKELAMDESKQLAIQGFLRDVYEINLNIENIQELSVKAINELEKHCVEFDFENNNQGIATYFPALYTDELLYTTDMLIMPTLAFSDSVDLDFDINKPHLCIIPGVEGYYESFTKMCERLKLPALVLHPGLDHPNETITELANRYISVLKKKATLNNNFYLLGYESGVLVALEMASILEKRGLTGTVFCIGGTPTEIVRDFKNNLNRYDTKEELQMGVLKHVYSLISKKDPSVIDHLCKNLEWEDKVMMTYMDFIEGKFPHSIQYIRKWIESIYSKLILMLENKYEMKNIKSKIILLRPQYSTNMDMSPENYSNHNIVTYQLDSPLSCAQLDVKCAAIINSHLDHDTLELFKNRNICHAYTVIENYHL